MNWYKKSQIDPYIKRIHELSKLIDDAYSTNRTDNVENMEEELEILIEKITTKEEDLLSEGYDVEGQGHDVSESASIEEQLAHLYYQYINFNHGYGPFSTKEDILENMRATVFDPNRKDNIDDHSILDAAKDAYNRKMNLRQRYELV